MNEQIQVILAGRGKSGAPLVDYEITDNGDGLGAHLTRWDAATLGVQPTTDELAAVTLAQLATQAASRADAQANSDLDQKVMKAVTQAIWEAIPAPVLNKGQLRARMLAIWKALP